MRLHRPLLAPLATLGLLGLGGPPSSVTVVTALVVASAAVVQGGCGHAVDPPDMGTLILDLARSGRPGLTSLRLPIQRIDLLYAPPPPDDKIDGGPGVRQLHTQCENLPSQFTWLADPVDYSITFPVGHPEAAVVAARPAPVGSIYEIRILIASPEAVFGPRSATVHADLRCQEGGPQLGVIRIRPVTGTFDIHKDVQTEVRARFNAMVDLYHEGHGKGVNDNSAFRLTDTLVGEEVPPDSTGVALNQWMIGFVPTVTRAQVDSVNAGIGATVFFGLSRIDEEWVKVPSNYLTQDVYAYFRTNPYVQFAHPVMTGHYQAPSAFPVPYAVTDPMAITSESGYGADANRFNAVNAPAAWDAWIAAAATKSYNDPGVYVGNRGTGAAPVAIAILDSGIDFTNPDLIPNLWINQNEIPAEVKARVYDCDCDGVLSFVDLNWDVYFPDKPCTGCRGTTTDPNPKPNEGGFKDPATAPTPDAFLNNPMHLVGGDTFLCDRAAHPPLDLCDPGDLVSGEPGSCPPGNAMTRTGHGFTCFTWEDGLHNHNVRGGAPTSCNWPSTPPEGRNGATDAGGRENNFCDDVVGWDFVREDYAINPVDQSRGRPNPLARYPNQTRDPPRIHYNYPFDKDSVMTPNGVVELSGHGTHVASVAGGVRGQNGVLGLAWNTWLVPVKIDREVLQQVMDGLGYASDNKIPIANMSVVAFPALKGLTPQACLGRLEDQITPLSAGDPAAALAFLRGEYAALWDMCQRATNGRNGGLGDVLVVSATLNCPVDLDSDSVVAFPASLHSLANRGNGNYPDPDINQTRCHDPNRPLCNPFGQPDPNCTPLCAPEMNGDPDGNGCCHYVTLTDAYVHNLVTVSSVAIPSGATFANRGQFALDQAYASTHGRVGHAGTISVLAPDVVLVDRYLGGIDSSGNAQPSVPFDASQGGTSLAAPQVSAAAALCASRRGVVTPDSLLGCFLPAPAPPSCTSDADCPLNQRCISNTNSCTDRPIGATIDYQFLKVPGPT